MITLRNTSIVLESETGKMYYLNPDTTLVPSDSNRQDEFEAKLKEFFLKFITSKNIEILCE